MVKELDDIMIMSVTNNHYMCNVALINLTKTAVYILSHSRGFSLRKNGRYVLIGTDMNEGNYLYGMKDGEYIPLTKDMLE